MEQYFPVVLFIMLFNMVMTSEFVDEILKCDHSKESFFSRTFLCLFVTVYAVQGDSTFESVDKILHQ